MPAVRIKRGTRAQIDAAAAANGLVMGEPYLITDEHHAAIGTGINTYEKLANFGDFPGISGIDTQGGLIAELLGPANGTYKGTPIALTANRMVKQSFLVRRAFTFTALSTFVQTGVAGKARIALHECNVVDGTVGALIADSGDLDTGSAGLKSGVLGASVSVDPGWYYLFLTSNAAPTLLGWQISEGGPMGVVASNGQQVTYEYQLITAGWTGNPTPPSSGWSFGTAASALNIPMCFLRA